MGHKQHKPKQVAGAPTVITADQFCELWGVTRQKLKKLERDGLVVPILLGANTKRYLASDVPGRKAQP